jgi:hypothetical protein
LRVAGDRIVRLHELVERRLNGPVIALQKLAVTLL